MVKIPSKSPEIDTIHAYIEPNMAAPCRTPGTGYWPGEKCLSFRQPGESAVSRGAMNLWSDSDRTLIPTCNIVYWCMLRYFDIIDISFIFLQICLHENLSMRKRCSTHLYVFRYLYIYIYIYDRMTSIHIYRYTYRYTDTYTEPYIYIYTRTLYTYTFAFTYTFVYCVFSKLKPYQHCDHPQVPAGSVRPLGGFRTEAIHGADGFCWAWLIKLRWIP